MPMPFRIDADKGIIFSTAEGEISDRALLDHQTSFRTHPDFRPDLHQLCDFRRVTSVSRLTTQGIQALALSNPFSAGARRAFVTADEVLYGLMRMFQLISERAPPEVAIFDDDIEALAWIETGVRRSL